MSVIEDVRKVVQDLITPDLKAQVGLIRGNEESSRLRFAALEDKVDARFDNLREFTELNYRALNAKIDSNHQSVIYALNIDKRLEALEHDRQSEAVSAT
jgi:hypothetical protein